MKTTQISVSAQDTKKIKGDLLVFLSYEDKKGNIVVNERVRDYVNSLCDQGDFKAKEGESAVFYPEQVKNSETFKISRVAIVGIGTCDGKNADADFAESLRVAGGHISKICDKYKVSTLVVNSAPLAVKKSHYVTEHLTEGILLGDYRFDQYKKKDEKDMPYAGIEKIVFSSKENSQKIRKHIKIATAAVTGAKSARDMANEPGNKWTPSEFAAFGKNLAKKSSLKCTVIEKADMKKLGMGGILAVNQGSSEAPKLVILDHNPPKSKKTLLLVGKGLTFDSGGISIKPAQGMQDMKYDMCGGAAVMGAMEAVAELNPSIRVVGIVPSTDNMSGSSALKPGDIITHYGGLTSEIVNTDAEGRLILADAIGYGIKEYKPDYLVDLATLTGAVIIGLGHHYTGVLSNNDTLSEMLIDAGKISGEPVWRLPLGKEYTKQIDSQVADMKNTGGRPAGTITAAAYLEKFVGETAWAHLDIAGTAWDFTEKSYIPKGPSGIMVRTLVRMIRDYAA